VLTAATVILVVLTRNTYMEKPLTSFTDQACNYIPGMSFPGATILDIEDYLKPVIRKESE
jgi:hypothetical protein